MKQAAKYATWIIVVHFLVNIAHGVAHRELQVGLTPLGSAFVVVVILAFPLIAMGLVWTTRNRLGFILLSLSMLASLLFGLYHHFIVGSPDHVHAQPTNFWGITFVLTAYGLLILEAIGTYLGIHFLWLAPQALSNTGQSIPR